MNIMADDERNDAPGGEEAHLDDIVTTGDEGEGGDAAKGGDESEDDGGQAQGGDDDRGDAPTGDEDEDVILLGDEAAPASDDDEGAPQWVKDLRKRARELERENKELKAKGATPPSQPQTLRPKPTLADHDYDEDAYAADVEAWTQEKAADDAAKAKAEEQQRAAQATWQAKLDAFGTAKKALKVPDFDDAEAEVTTKLNAAQQAIIVAYCANPAVVTYALGKRPEKLAELATIEDPIAFAIAASKLEGNLKVQKRNKPGPEGRVEGSAPLTGGAAKEKLQKLEREAERTGDRTKLIRYRSELRAQGKL